ncbi:MAG TPA: M42 family metallopeptidase [Verrucomicrobiae bacterium]|nr:M42 family metallopeptidase [Verrucomicrobiae bacterium]
MREQSYRFLEKLIAAPSPSGYEQPAQRVFREYISQFAVVSTDIMGNTIGLVSGEGDNRMKVMVVAHADEVGLQVKYIDENGFIYFGAIGGIDPHVSVGRRVNIHTENGPVLGVIGRKPVHLHEPKDRDNVVKLDSQYIDIGALNRKDAEEMVRPGDPVTFAEELTRLKNDRLTSRGFDDKAGCFIVAEVLRMVAEADRKPPIDLYAVASVQEELGLRGGRTSAYSIDPDVGICVEVFFASDQPEVDKKANGEICLGKGPIIPRGSNVNHYLYNLFVAVARENDIPLQLIGLPRASGTDANVMQVSRGGVATALVTIPLRNMHSPVEVVSTADLESCCRLIFHALYELTDRRDLIPE